MVNAQRDPRTQTLLLHPILIWDPQCKMALGVRSRRVDNATYDINVNDVNNVDPPLAEKEGVIYDPEANNEKGRKTSRIGGVMGESDGDSQLSVGKQLELEATNSIKYRTCSWQKVITHLSLAFLSHRACELSRISQCSNLLIRLITQVLHRFERIRGREVLTHHE